MGKWIRLGGIIFVGLVLFAILRTYYWQDISTPRLLNEADEEVAIEPGLSLQDVTLEQPDASGNLLWRVKGASVSYSPNQEVATIEAPDGELYQDGELIYRVQAEEGEIRENGQVVFLSGKLVATGIENGIVLRGQEAEWQVEENILTVRDRITGSHPQMNLVADEARVYNRDKRLVLLGEVAASTVVDNPKVDPWTKLQGSTITWLWEEQVLRSERPLRAERFENSQITDILTGNKGQMNLANDVMVLQDEVQLRRVLSPLVVQGETMTWQVANERVIASKPVTVVDPEQKIRVQAKQARMELAEEVIYLSKDVIAEGARNRSRLASNTLTWYLKPQTVVAEGNVRYRQQDPTFNLAGPRAVGKIESETVVVSGGRVVTEIVPDFD